MSVLKRKRVREILHDEGILRISHGAVEALDEAVESLVRKVGRDVATAYPGKELESDLVVRLGSINGGWCVRVKRRDEEKEVEDLDELVKAVPLRKG